MKKFLLIGFVIIQAFVCSAIEFTFTDNSDNEDGFQLCEVEEVNGVVTLVSILSTVDKDIESFSLPIQTVRNKKVAVRAFNIFGYSGFSNSVQVGDIPNEPTKLITITINVQIP